MVSKRCPQCQKDVATRSENPAFPFCSPRCRMLDLGKWLGEEYRIPVGPAPEAQEDELPPEAKPDDHDHWGDA